LKVAAIPYVILLLKGIFLLVLPSSSDINTSFPSNKSIFEESFEFDTILACIESEEILDFKSIIFIV